MGVKKAARRGQRARAAEVMTEINSELGEAVIMLGNDPYFEIVRIPTGSLTIDRLTGGGFALGRHVELYGDESAGKSAIAYMTMALSQARGNLCALVDPEKSFDPDWFRHLGGIPEELMIERPKSAEEAIKVMMLLGEHGVDKGIEVVMVDSVAALLPLEELSKDPTEEDRIAPQARMMSRALRRITSQNKRTLFLWTNQTRTAIGNFFGNPTTTPGGRALKFYDTTRIELKKGEKIKRPGKKAAKGKLVEKQIVEGHYVYARSEKEKSTRPHREGTFEFDGKVGGISLESEIINLGLEDGLIQRSGNTFSYLDVDDYNWAGSDKQFRRMLMENDEMRTELIEAIQDMTIQISLPGGRADNGKDDVL
jgi:recombination protein RecA